MSRLGLAFIALSLSLTAAAGPIFTVKDVGVVGLMSHDTFAWDRRNEVNTENGRLDLSTIFDWENGSMVDKGGNPKNAENAPVWSVTKRLVDHYRSLCPKPKVCVEARLATVALFHKMVEESYKRITGEEMPASMNGAVDNTEQAVLRSMHDVLPGKIKLFRFGAQVDYTLTNAFTAKFYLNDRELAQTLRPFDGDYDAEYKAIQIPFTNVKVDLMKVDREFIEKFSTFRQADMLAELKEVGEGRRDFMGLSFIHHFREMVAKITCPSVAHMPERACE